MGKINTRVQHKHDQDSNWSKATNFTPLEGELILYDSDIITDESTGETTLVMGYNFKIGNGTNKINDLPFILPELQNGTGNYALQQKDCHAVGDYSLAFGTHTYATKVNAMALGYKTVASGERSLALGNTSSATANYAVAIGKNSNANGAFSVSIGENTTTQGQGTLASGYNLIAFAKYQVVSGKYNEIDNGLLHPNLWSATTTYNLSYMVLHNGIYYRNLVQGNVGIEPGTNDAYWVEQPSYYRGTWTATETYQSNQIVLYNKQYYRSRVNNNIGREPGTDEGTYWYPTADAKYANIIGWGTSDTNRLNIHTVSTTGDGWFKGDLYVGGRNQAFGKKIATEEYVDTHIPEVPMIYVQETTPEGATTGALWIDTSEVSIIQAEEVSF